MGFVFIPGTWSGLALRVSQVLFSAASGFTMINAYGNLAYSSVYGYLVLVMFMESVSSLIQSGIYLYYIMAKKNVDSAVISLLSFCVACASAAVTVLFVRDMKLCRSFAELSCGRFQLSVVLGFVAWSLEAISALSMFCLLVALVSRHVQ